jgi:DtxR family transcriptional regulator, Mn-dependent transcriptional regulator
MPKVKKHIPLSDLKEGESGAVIRVNDFDNEFLNYLTELGTRLNEIIRVKENRNFDESLLIQIKGKPINISQKLAENIFIELKKVKGT